MSLSLVCFLWTACVVIASLFVLIVSVFSFVFVVFCSFTFSSVCYSHLRTARFGFHFLSRFPNVSQWRPTNDDFLCSLASPFLWRRHFLSSYIIFFFVLPRVPCFSYSLLIFTSYTFLGKLYPDEIVPEACFLWIISVSRCSGEQQTHLTHEFRLAASLTGLLFCLRLIEMKCVINVRVVSL